MNILFDLLYLRTGLGWCDHVDFSDGAARGIGESFYKSYQF
jgi:hypothetical protein